VARGGQQAVPDEELLLLPHCDQQIDCCCAGLGGRVLVTWSYHTVLSGWWYTQCSQLMCGCTSLYTDGMLVLS